MEIKELITRSHILWDEEKPLSLERLMASEAEYVITAKPKYKVYSKADILYSFIAEKTDTIELSKVKPEDITIISAANDLSILEKIPTMTVLVLDQDNKPIGAIQGLTAIAKATMDLRRELWNNTLQIEYYKRVFNAIEDEIFLTDEYGFIQYLNPRAEEICQIKLEDYIGHHIIELVQEGVISTSLTMEVLETKAKVARIMEVQSGRLILGTGLPVYDDEGNIFHVLSTSKDVKEIN